jgi:hypothetical protein
MLIVFSSVNELYFPMGHCGRWNIQKYYTKVASRVHAKLELRGRQLLLTDLGT